MSLEFAVGKKTILCDTLPNDIVKHYYNKLTDKQCQYIVDTLESHLFQSGFETFESKNWNKFLSALDRPNHKLTYTKDNNFYVTFDADGRMYPLEEYVKDPHDEIYIDLDTVLESKATDTLITTNE